jgi:hypothetical protein
MKINLLFLCVLVLFLSMLCFPQTTPIIVKYDEKTQQTLDDISDELTHLTKSLQTFNQRLYNYLESVNKYKGVQLTEKQQ